jgi:hypothetical protein
MSVDSSHRIVHKRLLDSRLVATADQPFGHLRPETQPRDLGQTQAGAELSMRQAAEMETGRARNIYTIA